MASDNGRSSPRWLESLSRNPGPISVVIGAVDFILAVAALIVGVKFKGAGAVEVIAMIGFALVTGMAAVWHRSRDPEAMSAVDATRILLLIVGGALGFAIAFAACARALLWRSYFVGGMEAWQGEGGWRVWACVLAGLIGLAIMFFSLTLARAEERSVPVLRRLLYGYNAVLTGLLVLAILVGVNVLVYLYAPPFSDWTAAGIYSLDSKSKNILANLDQPVKVYVMLSEGEDAGDLKNLLENCQAVTNKLTVEYLSVHREPKRVGELIHRYQLPGESGILVVYGTDPNESHQFIKARDELFEVERGATRRDPPRLKFKGEDALVSTIEYLKSGKSKAVVYFTQGNGELDLEDSSLSTGLIDKGAGLLRDRLQKSNYEVKGLKIGIAKDTQGKTVVAEKIPDDAAVVIVAGPRQPLAADTLKALRDYLKPADPKKKKGKLIAFLDVVVQDGKMVQTGLEPLLAEFNVQVENNRILSLRDMRVISKGGGNLQEVVVNPQRVSVTPNPALTEQNPIAKAFEGLALPLDDVRVVRPAKGAAPGAFRAEVLLQTSDIGVWAEDNLSDPTGLANEYYTSRREDLRKKISREPLPVAVVVSEAGAGPDARDPHQFMNQQPGRDTPRLVVFGDATVASNRYMRGSDTTVYSLIASSLSWLRERPENIGIEAKKRDVFALSPTTNISRLIWLPAGLMLFGIVGLGLGVWVVRRR